MQYLRITDNRPLRRGIYFAIVPGLMMWFAIIASAGWFWSLWLD
jgi:hypothetical protein